MLEQIPSRKERKVMKRIIRDLKHNPNLWVFLESDMVFLNKKRNLAVRERATGIEISFFFAPETPPATVKMKPSIFTKYYINTMKKIISHRDKELDFFLYQFEGKACSTEENKSVTS
jgi:hypothetical protein